MSDECWLLDAIYRALEEQLDDLRDAEAEGANVAVRIAAVEWLLKQPWLKPTEAEQDRDLVRLN
jgi:hypothetical protein